MSRRKTVAAGLMNVLGLALPVLSMLMAFVMDDNLRRHQHIYGGYYRGVVADVLIFLGWPIAVLVGFSRLPEAYKITAILYVIGSLVGIAITATVG